MMMKLNDETDGDFIVRMLKERVEIAAQERERAALRYEAANEAYSFAERALRGLRKSPQTHGSGNG